MAIRNTLPWFVLLATGLVIYAPAYASVEVHGLLDLVAAQRSDTHELNKLTRGDSSYDPYGLRVFLDADVNEHLDVFGQVVLRDGAMRPEAAFPALGELIEGLRAPKRAVEGRGRDTSEPPERGADG
jgi:hypothetical protein